MTTTMTAITPWRSTHSLKSANDCSTDGSQSRRRLHPPPTHEPNPTQQPTASDLRTITYLEEFISETMDDSNDRSKEPDGHQLQRSFHDILVLQTRVMEKLIVMIGDLITKIAQLITAKNCPPKSLPLSSPVTLRHPIRIKSVPISHIRTHKKAIPAKPPFPPSHRPPMTRTKDGMRPP